MSIYTKLYWLTRLDSINGCFLTMMVLSGIAFFIYGIFYFFTNIEGDKDDVTEYAKKFKSLRNLMIVLFITGGIFRVFVPSKNEMILIVAGGKTINYIQSDTSLAKLPYQTTDIISTILDKKIKEIKDEVKK